MNLIEKENLFGRTKKETSRIGVFGVGYDKVDLKAASQYGICVVRTAGANATGVAEMALTMILATRRQIMQNRAVVESGVWVKNVGTETVRKTVGIVGFGTIGQILAKLLSGFDCEILAYDPFPNTAKMDELGVKSCELDYLVEHSDAISIHVPYSEQTHHLFNADRIAKMKKSAVLVCTARGNIVDEDALYDALVSNRIAGAGLDVYATEPLLKTSKLIGLPNVVLTPHVASQTMESLWAVYKKAIDLAVDFYQDKELQWPDLLNPDYKKA